jgi:methylated-DNA-[protein]-cysteine S-methyltransferase
MTYITIQSPIGELTIVAEGEHITHIYFHCEAVEGKIQRKDTPALIKAAKQLEEYFEGRRKTFDVPIKPSGGAFHKKVWEVMIAKVPFGNTVSYSEIARMAGSSRAARAVGMANNRNPIPIIIPCHRVVGKCGKLTGFRAGLDIKEKLLELENAGK